MRNVIDSLRSIAVRAGWDELGRLIYPPECAMCETLIGPQARFCEPCWSKLTKSNYACHRCGLPLPSVVPNDSCARCRKAKWRFDQVVALGPYRGRLREAVILSKKLRFENLRHGLAELLAERITSRMLANQIGMRESLEEGQTPIVVPVPNHWSRVFARTAPTASSLAWRIGAELGWEVRGNLVRRIRKTAKQGMLSSQERRQNVRGAFKIVRAPNLNGRQVWVVDDVMTSGATVNELARVLRKSGAGPICVAVVARGSGRG